MDFNKLRKKVQTLFQSKPEPQIEKKDDVLKDEFGNKIDFGKMTDGNIRKSIQTSKLNNFYFLNNIYSFEILKAADIVKIYWNDRRSERKLIRDMYGRLFLYSYTDDGFDDRIDISWTFVTDEKESDELSQGSNLSLLQYPFVANDGTNWMAAHEIVEKLSNSK